MARRILQSSDSKTRRLFYQPRVAVVWFVFTEFFNTFGGNFYRHFKMADARFEDTLEYFLDNDSGDEFEGFNNNNNNN